MMLRRGNWWENGWGEFDKLIINCVRGTVCEGFSRDRATSCGQSLT